MKIIKIYLIIASLMLVAALGTGVYVWYVYQSIPRGSEASPAELVEELVVTETTPIATSSAKTPIVTEAPVIIDATKLTDTQRGILESFGYTSDSVTVSQATIECAKEAVGATRFEAILNGSAPAPLEAMKLLPCVKR